MKLMSHLVTTLTSTTLSKELLRSSPSLSSSSNSDNIVQNSEYSRFNNDDIDDLPHWKYHPNVYSVYRLNTPVSIDQNNMDSSTNADQIPLPAFHIDGNIEKDVWSNIPWSNAFGDIQGYDEPEPKQEIPTTRFKAVYDDTYLYIIAEIYPARGIPTMAHFTERNSPIYQRDSDFEVFIDVDNSNHMYKELEVNAINTVWNLLLDKPYDDGGQEHSGRIAKMGESLYYDVRHQQTATKVVSGIINDTTNNTGALWIVEMALSYKDLLSNTTITKQEKYTPTNQKWRVNFSRVEREGEINWTWQPQIRWNPSKSQYNGFVQMHLPDSWGYFHFVDANVSTIIGTTKHDADENNKLHQDPLWPEKLTAMTVYYALHYYKSQYGKFTNRISDLILPSEIIAPFHIDVLLISCDEDSINNSSENEIGFLVLVYNTSTADNYVIQVRDDRLLTVVYNKTTTTSRTIQS